MRQQGRLLLCMALCTGALLLTSCQAPTNRSTESPGSGALTDIAPFVRQLPVLPMSEPMMVEFDLQPPPKNADPTLFLGIRVNGEDGLKSLEAAEEIRNSGLKAQLLLKRVDLKGSVAVPLVAVESSVGAPARISAIPATGHVVGGWLDEVDTLSMRSSGLESAESHYTHLALAWAQSVPPGKYQLSIRLIDPPANLVSTKAELLVAYRHKSK